LSFCGVNLFLQCLSTHGEWSVVGGHSKNPAVSVALLLQQRVQQNRHRDPAAVKIICFIWRNAVLFLLFVVVLSCEAYQSIRSRLVFIEFKQPLLFISVDTWT